MIQFYLAETDHDYVNARILYKEYAATIMINLDFQHFDDELNNLKEMYAKPYGGIILAKDDNEIFGCIAIRKFNATTAELKRMYIKSAYQNKGIGKSLLHKAILLAKKYNYSLIKLDTLNSMDKAIHLYKLAGFYETPPYYQNPIPTAIYFEKVI